MELLGSVKYVVEVKHMEYHKCYRCICSVCQDNNSCLYHRCDECDPEEEYEWVFCCGDVKRKEEDRNDK